MVPAIASRTSFGLEQLIRPLSPAYFWSHAAELNGGYVSHGRLRRFGRLLSTRQFTDVYRIIRAWRSPIVAWSTDGEIRLSISPDQARQFYHAGFNLYFREAQDTFPELLALRQDIAVDFGVSNEDVYFELFASPAKAGAPAHFDHEINFNVLLAGRKKWWLAENRTFRNPTQAYALSSGRNVPEELRVACIATTPRKLNWRRSVYCSPGSCVYLPRGCWHKTYALEPTVALNCTVLPPTWLSLMVAYVSQCLSSEHDWREFALGYVSRSSGSTLSTRVDAFKRAVQDLDARQLARVLRA